MDQSMRNAFAEVYDIIYHMDGELIDKIPDEFLDMIEEEMNDDYDVVIDYSININDQELLPETRGILAIIYEKFLTGEETQKTDEFGEEASSISNNLEERLKNLGVIKEKEKVTIEEVKETALSTNVSHESWFQKILNFFKKKKM